MEFETRYRENTNTQNIKVGMLRVPKDFINAMEKDAKYKISLVKTGNPEKATQGRPRKAQTPTPTKEAEPKEQSAPTLA